MAWDKNFLAEHNVDVGEDVGVRGQDGSLTRVFRHIGCVVWLGVVVIDLGC